MISNEYRKLNEQQHKKDPQYGTSGWKSASTVLQLHKRLNAGSVLDYGCGKGMLKHTLPHTIDVREFDPAVPGKDAPPAKADIVVVADVMEHVEPDHVTSVLAHVGDLTGMVAYFVISLAHGTRTLPDGSLCHRTVETVDWWRDRLKAIGNVYVLPPTAEFRDELVCLVYPKEGV